MLEKLYQEKGTESIIPAYIEMPNKKCILYGKYMDLYNKKLLSNKLLMYKCRNDKNVDVFYYNDQFVGRGYYYNNEMQNGFYAPYILDSENPNILYLDTQGYCYKIDIENNKMETLIEYNTKNWTYDDAITNFYSQTTDYLIAVCSYQTGIQTVLINKSDLTYNKVLGVDTPTYTQCVPVYENENYIYIHSKSLTEESNKLYKYSKTDFSETVITLTLPSDYGTGYFFSKQVYYSDNKNSLDIIIDEYYNTKNEGVSFAYWINGTLDTKLYRAKVTLNDDVVTFDTFTLEFEEGYITKYNVPAEKILCCGTTTLTARKLKNYFFLLQKKASTGKQYLVVSTGAKLDALDTTAYSDSTMEAYRCLQVFEIVEEGTKLKHTQTIGYNQINGYIANILKFDDEEHFVISLTGTEGVTARPFYFCKFDYETGQFKLDGNYKIDIVAQYLGMNKERTWAYFKNFTDGKLDIVTLKDVYKFDIQYPETELVYKGEDIPFTIKFRVLNHWGELLQRQCKITIVGSAQLNEGGTEKTITSSNSDYIDIPLKITTYGKFEIQVEDVDTTSVLE